jgi:hypothetical protein
MQLPFFSLLFCIRKNILAATMFALVILWRAVGACYITLLASQEISNAVINKIRSMLMNVERPSFCFEDFHWRGEGGA